jgi:hypothetical protein
MADISDVEQTIADTISSVVYPAGSTRSSIIGVTCRVYRGWPNSATLNADLSAGLVNVTVIADNDSGQTTTRYLPSWQTIPSYPGVIATVSLQNVILSGIPLVGDVVGILINGAAYAYRIQAGDTADLVASNLTAVIQPGSLAMVNGSTITVPGAALIEARVVCDGITSFESRRQEKDVRIICWCPSPQIRDDVASAIDFAINQNSFLLLSDQTRARVIYKNTTSYDQAQNALLYRRDLVYCLEYPTVSIFAQPSMLFGASDINGNITYG